MRKVTAIMAAALVFVGGSATMASAGDKTTAPGVKVCVSADVTVNGMHVVDESHCVQN
jgi:hypothetical protein